MKFKIGDKVLVTGRGSKKWWNLSYMNRTIGCIGQVLYSEGDKVIVGITDKVGYSDIWSYNVCNLSFPFCIEYNYESRR